MVMSAWENLHYATLELVRATPLKQRLVAAYRRHLVLITPDQLPLELREAFGQMKGALEAGSPLRHEEAVVAAVRKMSAQDAEDCASSIVEMLGTLSRALSRETRREDLSRV